MCLRWGNLSTRGEQIRSKVTPGSAVQRASRPMRGHLLAEHTGRCLHFHCHQDECRTRARDASRHTEQTLHTSKHKPSREPRRRGTFERHPAPVPGAPWHLGPVLEPASRPRPSLRVPQHSCLVKRESRRGQMLRLSQPFLILEFVALTLRSINTRFAILKFSHVSVWVLSFMLKPCSPPSPAIFPARTPRVQGCTQVLRRCSSAGPRRHSSGHTHARIPDLRHQGWQVALEEGLREDQIFKQVLIVQLPSHLKLL